MKKGKRNDYRPRFKKEEQHLWSSLISKIKKIGVVKASIMFSENAPSKKTETFEEDRWQIVEEGTPISTKEELIKACNIDTNIWDIPKFTVSSWGQNSKKAGYVQLYSIRAVCVKKSVSSLDNFLKKLEDGSYKIPKVRNIKTKNIDKADKAIILNLYDAHLDKVTRATETGEFSDINKNCELFREAFYGLLEQANSPECIYFPIGNDLFNVNDTRNTTKRGTQQDTILHHVDAFEIILDLLIELINKAAKIAPVHIPMVAGNHDTDAVHILGVVLSKIYAKCDNVTINYNRLPRKYIRYGANMFLFEHGDGLKLNNIPITMAQEQPEMWNNTKYRYCYLGHLHHTKGYLANRTIDQIGVEIRHSRAMSAKDNYHFKKGYIGIPKSAEMIIASKCGRFYNIHRYSF